MEGSIRKGQSFKDGSNLSTLMKDKKYSIVVGLQISNWTRYPLVDPHAFNESGYLSSAVIDINPNKQEALVGITTFFSSPFFKFNVSVSLISQVMNLFHGKHSRFI